MKLISGFILQDLGDEHMAVATGEAGKVFHGLVRSNDTADFIIRELMHETTEEEIVDRMVEKYDAPRERIAKDVHRILEQFREAGILEE